MKIILAGLTVAAIALQMTPAHAAPYFTQNSFDKFTVNNGEVTAQGAAHCENPQVAPTYLTITAADTTPTGKLATAELDPSRTRVTSVEITTPQGPKFWYYRAPTPGVAGTPGSAAVTKADNGGFAVVGTIAVQQGAASVGAPVPFEIDVMC